MYQVRLDDEILHDLREEDRRLVSAKLYFESNKVDRFGFEILPTHPCFNDIKKLKSIISVFAIKNTNEYEKLFEGRIPELDKDFNNIGEAEAEGVLSYFRDSIQRPFEFHDITPEDFLKEIVNRHNEGVDETKRFEVGDVTVTGNLYRMNEKYVTTLEILNDRLIDRLGGYFRVRYVGDKKIIDYLKDFDGVNAQTIEFGENLLDLTQVATAADVYSVVIPIGAQDEDGNALTIKSVNDGKDYLENHEAIALYGRREAVVEFSDVTLASNLKTKGEEYLQSTIEESLTIEMKAVDLSLINHNIQAFRMYDWVKVISKPHSIIKSFLLKKMEINLIDPTDSYIQLGQIIKGISDEIVVQNKTKTKVETLQTGLAGVVGVVSDVNQIANNTVVVVEEISKNQQQTADSLLELTINMQSLIETVSNNTKTLSDLSELMVSVVSDIETQKLRIDKLKKYVSMEV
ncbi:MAG: phage tail protein [Turicibacter sp.]